jgi:hypothetical protein
MRAPAAECAITRAGCDPRDVLAALRRIGLTGAGGDARRDGGDGLDGDAVAGRTAVARRIWEGARDARGTPVVADDFLPKPRVLHPWPNVRFAVRHPR